MPKVVVFRPLAGLRVVDPQSGVTVHEQDVVSSHTAAFDNFLFDSPHGGVGFGRVVDFWCRRYEDGTLDEGGGGSFPHHW